MDKIRIAGLEALHFLRKANLQPGQKVLIIGAGGSIGTFAVQLARHWEAEVTGVDSTEKLDMPKPTGMRKQGAKKGNVVIKVTPSLTA